MRLSFILSHYIESARFGALSPYIKPYTTLLLNNGYKPTTIRGQLRLIARLNRWLLRMDYDLRGLNERVLAHFWKREQKKRRTPASGTRLTLQRLLGVLRDSRVASPAERASVPQTAVQCLIENYRCHLLDDQGLAESTVVNYAWHVQKFLGEQFGEGAVNLVGLQAQDAIRFIRQTAHHHSIRHAQLLVAALRSFFRFLHYQGKIETDLAPALPNVANWTLSSLPKYISADAVQRVLDKCDRQTTIGRRDYAVLLLLARLGMRGGEVLRLNLEDVDWQNACIIVRARKGPGSTRLPLTMEVGEAIARYLHHDRPSSDCRRVFLRARAPHVALSHTAVISSLVRRALKKAGVDSARKGAHLFRHSLATDMLRHGASLNEIGELLRHHSANSTAIYAKVELEALRPLALSWPGGVR
ncbi:MAG: site-specific integrase [Chthoniobacterales bacterium]